MPQYCVVSLRHALNVTRTVKLPMHSALGAHSDEDVGAVGVDHVQAVPHAQGVQDPAASGLSLLHSGLWQAAQQGDAAQAAYARRLTEHEGIWQWCGHASALRCCR